MARVVVSFHVQVEECLDNVDPEMPLSLRAQLGLHVGVLAVLVGKAPRRSSNLAVD